MPTMCPETLTKGKERDEDPLPCIFVFPISQWVKPCPPLHAALSCPQNLPTSESLPSGNIYHEISGTERAFSNSGPSPGWSQTPSLVPAWGPHRWPASALKGFIPHLNLTGGRIRISVPITCLQFRAPFPQHHPSRKQRVKPITLEGRGLSPNFNR